jgi:hypothetical protein
MNISVLQSIRQLLLICSPCQNPYLLFLCLLAELHPSAGHFTTSSAVLSKFQLECVYPFWLASIAVTLQSESNGWSTTLEDPSILQQLPSVVVLLSPFWSRWSIQVLKSAKRLVTTHELKVQVQKEGIRISWAAFQWSTWDPWVVEVLVGCSSKVCRQLSCSLFYSSFSDICAMCPLLFFQVFFSFFFRSEWQSLLIEELFGLEHTLQCLLASRKVRRALLPNSAITTKNLQSSR